MSILPIILAPDPVLRKKALKVTVIDQKILTLLDNMVDTMYDAPGIGLAAQQVGDLNRLIVLDCSKDEEEPRLFKMINPEIKTKTEIKTKIEEGCLSIPGFNAEVERYAEITVNFLDTDGKKNEINFNGLEAICIQHEVDHLNGILFIDHLTRLKKNMIWQKILKNRKMKK